MKPKVSTTGARSDAATPSAEKFTTAAPKTCCCVFCNSIFQFRAGSDSSSALITDPNDLRRIGRHLAQEFEIDRCELVLSSSRSEPSTPFCPSCTELVKKMDQMCCQVEKLKTEIAVKRNVLIESAVNTFVYADRDGPYFRIKYNIFGRWSRVIQGDGLQQPVSPVIAAAPVVSEDGSQNGHSTGEEEEESSSESSTPERTRVSVSALPSKSIAKPAATSTPQTSHQKKKPFVDPACKKRKYEESKEGATSKQAQTKEVHPKSTPAPASDIDDDENDGQNAGAVDRDGPDNDQTDEDEEDEGKYEAAQGQSSPIVITSKEKPKARARQTSGGLTEKQKLGTLASMMFKNLKSKKKTEQNQEAVGKDVTPPPPTPSKAQFPKDVKDRPGPASKKKKLAPAVPTPSTNKQATSASKSEAEAEEVKDKKPPAPAAQRVVIVGSDSEDETSDEECRVCHKICRSKEIKRKHMESHGGGPDKHPCSRCVKHFYSLGALRKHMSVVHGEKFESPAKASKTPAKKSQGHRASSNAESEGRGGVLRLNFGAQSTSPQQQQAGRNNPNNKFSCSVCQKNFPQRTRLQRHMRKAHRLKPTPKPSKASDAGTVTPSTRTSRNSVSTSTKSPIDPKLKGHAVPVLDRNKVAFYFQGKAQSLEGSSQRQRTPPETAPTSSPSERAATSADSRPAPAPASVQKKREAEASPTPAPAVVKKSRPAPASIKRQREREAAAAAATAETQRHASNTNEPPVKASSPWKASTRSASPTGLPSTATPTASYWSDPTAILATLSATAPASSSSILTERQRQSVVLATTEKSPPLQPTSATQPVQRMRQARAPTKGKQPPSQIQIMKAKLAKSMMVAGRKAACVNPTASLIALGTGRASAPIPGVRSAWGAPSTGLPLCVDSASLGEPPLYVGPSAKRKSTVEVQAHVEDGEFDPRMFVEVGTEQLTVPKAPPQPTIVKPRLPPPVKTRPSGNRLPPGLKIVDLQNIIGVGASNQPSSSSSSPAPAPLPEPEEPEESPIKICNIRSLCGGDGDGDDDEPQPDIIELESEEQPTSNSIARASTIPALSLARRPLPSPRRRSIVPKINVSPPRPLPLSWTRVEPSDSPTRVREVLLPPAQPYKRKKGPAPRARVATITDTTTFKPSGGGGQSQGHSNGTGAGSFPFYATF